MTIPQAYQFALDEAQKLISESDVNRTENTLPNQKQEWIQQQLEIVDDIFRQITLNYAENCEKITTCCENALMKLQLLTRDKLELLLSIETELRRETEEINWLEYHLKQQIKLAEQNQQQNQKRWNHTQPGSQSGSVSSQLQFLKYWKNSILIMNSLNRSHASETDMLKEIVPDMRVDCDIKVYLQNEPPPPSMPPRSPVIERKKSDQSSTLPSSLPLEKNISNLTVGVDELADHSPRPTSPLNPTGSVVQPVSAYDLQNFLGSLQRIDYYAPRQGEGAPRPLEPLISPSTQALVNVNLMKIERLLNEIREDDITKKAGGLLLPTSITRPIFSGIMYSIPGTVENTYSGNGREQNLSDDLIQKSLENSLKNVINLQQSQSSVGKGITSSAPTQQVKRSSTLGSPMMHRKSGLVGTPFSSTSFMSTHDFDHQSQTDDSASRSDHPHGVSGYDIAHDQHSMDVIEQLLQVTAPYHPSYSLKEGSNKRQRQLSSTSFHFTEKYVFYGSQILTPVEAQVCSSIFMF